jgi:hypothetical protein
VTVCHPGGMDKPQPDFSSQLQQVHAQVLSLRKTLEQFRECAEQIQTTIVFGLHPELTELDDELDILYRGQM